MDKAEYQEKLEELTGYMNDKDYESALALANEIDWKRVKSIRTLNMVADVYEKNREYEDARRILLLALGRASVGRTILARLVEVSIKLGEIQEAEDYFDQFSKVAGNDNSRFVLQYKMFKAKRAPLEAQIAVLEEYRDREYTEKWAYELASLYAKAGDPQRCVAACDDLILWFGGGKYVLKALDLKMKYDTLSPSQRQLYEEEKAKAEKEAVMSVRKAATVNQTDAQMKDKIAESFQDVFSGLRRPPEESKEPEVPAVENTVPLDQLHISDLEPEHSDTEEVPAKAAAAETIVSVPKRRRGGFFRWGMKKEEKQEEKVWQDIGINKKKEEESVDLDSLLQETAGEFSREISMMSDAPELEPESELEGGTPHPEAAGSDAAAEAGKAAAEAAETAEKAEDAAGAAAEDTAEKAEEALTEAGAEAEAAAETVSGLTDVQEAAGEEVPGSGFFREAGPDEAVYQTGMLTAELPDIISQIEKKEPEPAIDDSAEQEPKEKKPSFWQRFRKGMKKLAAPGPAEEAELGEPVGEPPVIGETEEASKAEPEAAVPASVEEAGAAAGAAAEEAVTAAEDAAGETSANAAEMISGEVKDVSGEVKDISEEVKGAAEEGLKDVPAGMPAGEVPAAEVSAEAAETKAPEEETAKTPDISAVPAGAEESAAAEEAEGPSEAAAEEAEETGNDPASALRAALKAAAAMSASKNAEKAAEAEFAAAAREAGASIPGVTSEAKEAAAEEVQEAAAVPEVKKESGPDVVEAGEIAAGIAAAVKPRKSAFRDSIRAAVESKERERKAELEEQKRKEAEEAARQEEEAARARAEAEKKEAEAKVQAEAEAKKAEEEAAAAERANAEREALEIEKAKKAAAKRAERKAAEAKKAEEEAARAEEEKKAGEEAEAAAEKQTADAEASQEPAKQGVTVADQEANKIQPEDSSERKVRYNEELEVPDSELEDRLSHSRTLDLSKVGENTVPVSLDEIIMSETPEERRIRFLHNESSLRMNDDQRKIFTYFARIPGMDNQILSALSAVYQHADEHTSSHGNLAVIGAQGSGKSRLAKAMISAMCMDLGMEAAKVARLSGFQMNKKDPAKIVDKMSGGFLIVEECSEMNEDTVTQLGQAMDFRTDRMILILEDEKAAFRGFVRKYPEFAKKIDKTISIPIFTNDELITFARTYAAENGYTLDDMAILALYTIIGNDQSYEQPMTISKVKTLLDQAMSNSKRTPKRKKGRKGRGKDSELIVLQEKDFETN